MSSNRRPMQRLVHRCAATLILLLPCSLAAADQQASSCYRLVLTNTPDWISSGVAWDSENERILMVDTVKNQVVSYNILGDRLTISPTDERGKSLGQESPPAKIGRSKEGFLLELVDGSMLSLDHRLAVNGRAPTAKLSPTTKASLYQWVAEASSSLVAFAAVPRERTGLEYGFFRVHGNSKFQLLLPADEAEKDYFLVGHPYIASMADQTFFLSMAEHPALYRVREGKAEKLNVLPPKYSTRPKLTTRKMTGPSGAIPRFEEIEKLSMPTGLYAQDGYLYLLAREPSDGGRTTWWLYQIDPAGAGSIVGRVRLPTTANHLTVIPTPDRGWMFIEKGRVELGASGYQKNESMGPIVVISNAAIQSLTIPTSCPEGGGMLWADRGHSRALFIPETLLASKMILPVDVSSRNHLDLRFEGERKSASPCDFLEPSMGQGALPNASSLKDLVTSSPVAVVGRIVSTELGWDARLRHVVTKVNLEVMRSLKGAFKAGTRIDFLSPGGSMLLDDKRICTSPRRGFYQPRVGDEIVVSAEPSAADPRLLESPYVFPLSGGKVQPEPYPALLAQEKPLSLSKLLDSSSSGTF